LLFSTFYPAQPPDRHVGRTTATPATRRALEFAAKPQLTSIPHSRANSWLQLAARTPRGPSAPGSVHEDPTDSYGVSPSSAVPSSSSISRSACSIRFRVNSEVPRLQSLAFPFSFPHAANGSRVRGASEIIRIYEFLGTLESAFPWLAIFLSRGKRRGEFNFTDTPRLHSTRVHRGVWLHRARLVF